MQSCSEAHSCSARLAFCIASSARRGKHLHDVAQHVAEAALLSLHPEVRLFDGVQKRRKRGVLALWPSILPPQQPQQLQAGMLIQGLRSKSQAALTPGLT